MRRIKPSVLKAHILPMTDWKLLRSGMSDQEFPIRSGISDQPEKPNYSFKGRFPLQIICPWCLCALNLDRMRVQGYVHA
jgi:hypothetical protein